MIRHVTATELALYYNERLNVKDTEWVNRHLKECDACGEEYELMRVPLNDLRAGLVRGLWRRRFKHLWKRIQEARRDVAVSPGTGSIVKPGSDTEKAGAAVYSDDGRFRSLVQAQSRVEIERNGALVAHVCIMEQIDELNGKDVFVEMSNNLDLIKLGPARLTHVEDPGGNSLKATLKREADPKGGLTHEQLLTMSLFVRICS